MIETERLKIVPFDEPHFQAIFKKDLTELGRLLDIRPPDSWTTFEDMEDALPFFYEDFKKYGNLWGGYFTIHKADNCLIGTCGYKGKPDTEGVVEIGYEVVEGYRLRGIASEIAKVLTDFALKNASVNIVRAHTLAHNNPSVSVLVKNGYRLMGLFHEPDDGDVWRWEVYRKE